MPPKRSPQDSIKEIQQDAYSASITGESIIVWRDAVTDEASLPTTGNETGDHRVVEDTGFVRKWDGSIWIKVGGASVGGIPEEFDASSGELPEVTPGTSARWIISVSGTLPGIGDVTVGSYLIYDGTNFSYIDNPSGKYFNSNPANVAVGGLGANQGPFDTTVQDMLNKFLYPATALTASLGAGITFEKGAEQAPFLLTATFVKSTNPIYPVAEVLFKRGISLIDTKTGADLSSPQTFTETDSIIDTVIFSAEVTDTSPVTKIATKTLTAIYPYFRGKVTGGARPTRDQALINSGTKVVASSTGTITIDYESGATDWLWFAIPATSTSKTVWYQNALNNGTIGSPSDLFDAPELADIDSPTVLWNGISYKIYVSTYQTAVTGDPLQMRNS